MKIQNIKIEYCIATSEMRHNNPPNVKKVQLLLTVVTRSIILDYETFHN